MENTEQDRPHRYPQCGQCKGSMVMGDDMWYCQKCHKFPAKSPIQYKYWAPKYGRIPILLFAEGRNISASEALDYYELNMSNAPNLGHAPAYAWQHNGYLGFVIEEYTN